MQVLFLIFVRQVFVFNSFSFGFSYMRWNNEIMSLNKQCMKTSLDSFLSIKKCFTERKVYRKEDLSIFSQPSRCV